MSARTADASQWIRKQRVLSNVARLEEISTIEKKSMGQAVAELNVLDEDSSETLYEPQKTTRRVCSYPSQWQY
jgi:Fe-S cluster biosynthesis and repair protein YggX